MDWHPEFCPSYTPLEMLKLGVFEGKYINIIKGLPKSWYDLPKVVKRKDPPNVELNRFGIKSRQSLSEWKKNGWIKTDEGGWFHWYCLYFLGRRLGEEDEWQIKRWKSFVARHQAQVTKGCSLKDSGCRPKQRQGLLQWAWDSSTDFTDAQKAKNLKRIKTMSTNAGLETLDEFFASLERYNHVATSDENSKLIYVILTSTNTGFNKVATRVTGQKYNHISLMLEDNFDEIYTFSMNNAKNLFGGFMRENREDLHGSRYRLYSIEVKEKNWLKVKNKITEYQNNVENTTYSFKVLLNAIFNRNIFESETDSSMICSQFVLTMLREAGVEGFDDKDIVKLKPNDIINSRRFKYVKRGTITKDMKVSLEWM